jgi:hypothetical protein
MKNKLKIRKIKINKDAAYACATLEINGVVYEMIRRYWGWAGKFQIDSFTPEDFALIDQKLNEKYEKYFNQKVSKRIMAKER